MSYNMMIGYDIYDRFTMEHFPLRQSMILTTSFFFATVYRVSQLRLSSLISRLRDARVAGSIPTQGEIKKLKKKKGYILSRDSEVTLSHWSRSIELVIMPLIDL
jgi:hypothetical protein